MHIGYMFVRFVGSCLSLRKFYPLFILESEANDVQKSQEAAI